MSKGAKTMTAKVLTSSDVLPVDHPQPMKKEVSTMTRRNRALSSMFGVLLGLGAAHSAWAVPPTALTATTHHGIPYVSGGVSLDEQRTLRHLTQDDNLHLIFAARNGDYLSDVTVQIRDAQGHQVLEAASPGPWFFTKLPAGHYTVKATTLGKAQGARIAVPVTGQARVFLTWNDAILKMRPQSTAKR
jgi:hypothetical protein